MDDVDPLFRDPDRKAITDKTLVHIYDKDAEERIGQFDIDTSVHIPDVGETVELERGHLSDNASSIDDADSFQFDSFGVYEVVDRETSYNLVEWEQPTENGEESVEVDSMFQVLTLTVISDEK